MTAASALLWDLATLSKKSNIAAVVKQTSSGSVDMLPTNG